MIFLLSLAEIKIKRINFYQNNNNIINRIDDDCKILIYSKQKYKY